ncbi:MAG: sulfite exporter TauE/SafE family protein [Clostridia bacterium]|nr:sulfite exporter TauE/SafE family protein [Clostridia bacterium]
MKGVGWYLLAGLAGGVLGGMGLGGGTLLIPILTLCLGVEGRTAAWLNLLTFLPMSVVALCIHCKHRLVSASDLWMFLPPAVISALVAALLSSKWDADLLRKIFGWFLIVTGAISLFLSLLKSPLRKRKNR